MAGADDKKARFRALHGGATPFLMPNPFDAGTARFLAAMGFPALATSSAGFAWTLGLPDGGVPCEAAIAHGGSLAQAVDIPVSADLERGFGDSPEDAARTVREAAAAGLAGCSIEDFSGDPSRGIYDFSLAVERVGAAAQAARALPHDFVVTARAEAMLHAPDLGEAIRRLQAFGEAGADVLFAPGLSRMEDVRAVCQAVDKPVSVLAAAHWRLPELAEAGVKRISTGPRLSQSAFTAVEQAAREMLDEGVFSFAGAAVPFGRIDGSFKPDR
ncbi:MAG TPA: isocitrate lyase/phosphoenolpyruvate mutase family protein [Mesorhizobium sp.]|nr:isocitrate lyase/phosphoenolpyruvate mutase family protein [Mesorhizobium sp.]